MRGEPVVAGFLKLFPAKMPSLSRADLEQLKTEL
jgi:hypothetical protein